MTETERVEMTRAYIALSNAHRLEQTLFLFEDDATYYSDYVGAFDGKAAIARMMEAFYQRCPDIYWQVEEYRYSNSEDAVTFEFIRHATDRESGEPVSAAGRDIVRFSDRGLIRRVEVYKPV
ncbi:SnoaL-like domain-containing protein [Elysia marginata]|uniref:SnoaL-like domain-containing protein n=1 Tax=Elysia marginata TaxID=1093978 RepID=A0AAV4IA29_9GAST|nr:SnoaL-like domain-containing protein [Elysia marginata]